MDNLAWGLQMTLLGMGLVFALLALLWALLALALKLDRPEPPVQAAAVSGPPEPPAVEPALAAAITVAVLAHNAHLRAAAVPEMRIHWPGSLLHASRWVASGRLRQNRTFRKGR